MARPETVNTIRYGGKPRKGLIVQVPCLKSSLAVSIGTKEFRFKKRPRPRPVLLRLIIELAYLSSCWTTCRNIILVVPFPSPLGGHAPRFVLQEQANTSHVRNGNQTLVCSFAVRSLPWHEARNRSSILHCMTVIPGTVRIFQQSKNDKNSCFFARERLVIGSQTWPSCS